MSHYYKLKGARWLRLYTAAANTPVYAAQSDAQTIADTLCDVPWTRAGSDGPAMFTVHEAKVLDQNVGNRDLFDAAEFCAGHADGQHRVYANAAFYVCALPQAAQGATLESVKVHVHSDPYNELGVRIAVHLLDTDALPTDCATVRSGVAHADGQVPRTTQTVNKTNYWYAADGDVTITLPANTQTTAYLAVFVGLENYARSRSEWIEGSAYISNAITIATTEEISGWTENTPQPIDSIPNYGGEFAVVRGGVTQSLPQGSASGARVIQLQLNGDPLVPSWTDHKTDPSTTLVKFGDSVVHKIYGTVTDVNYSRKFMLGSTPTRLVAICGTFEDSTYGAPGVLLFNCATGQRINGAAETFDSSLTDRLQSATGHIGVSVVPRSVTVDGTATDVPFANLYYACMVDNSDDTMSAFCTTPYFLRINLSSGSAESFSGEGYYAVRAIPYDPYLAFFDAPPIYLESYGETEPSKTSPPVFFVLKDGEYHRPDGYPEGTSKLILGIDLAAWIRMNNNSGNISFRIVLFYEGTLSYASMARNDEDADDFDLVLSGNLSALKYPRQDGPLFQVESPVIVLHGHIDYPGGDKRYRLEYDGAPEPINVGELNTLSGLRVIETARGSNVFIVTGDFTTVNGDPSLRHAFMFNNNTGTRTALLEGQATLGAAEDFSVEAKQLSGTEDFYLAESLVQEPDAEGSSIGLRTLQAKFYQGALANVPRSAADRMGASFSVRSASESLKVVRNGMASSESVGVWRMFASALVVPFALPTAWTARKLRLDWTDWTGTATAGARFNVWLKAGDYIESCPDILASDIPYDALEAETAGWTLVGTVDAAGAATEATFELPEIAGKKTATLMLTAFASADRINPDGNSVWPVGAAKEVDATGGEVVNADKAWLPDVTLEG